MSANDSRKLLGKSRTVGSRAMVYQVDDGLEIEVNEQYDVVHKRVLFDDVIMVTIHREMGVAYLTTMAIISAFFWCIGLLILSADVDAWPAALVLGVLGLPTAILFLIRFLFGVDVVTVFGRRSKAALHFAMKKKHAREVYGSICAAVRSAHRRAAASNEPAPEEQPAQEQQGSQASIAEVKSDGQD